MTALTKAEVLARCTPQQIVDRDESNIAATINVGRTQMVKVPVLDVKAYLHSNNLWLPIKALAAESANPYHVAALALVEFAESGVVAMDVTLPIVALQLGALVAAGAIKTADKDAIIAMGTVPDLVSSFQVAQVLEGIQP